MSNLAGKIRGKEETTKVTVQTCEIADRPSCENQRESRLVSTSPKLLEDQSTSTDERCMLENQVRFHPDKECIDQTIILRMILKHRQVA